MSTQLLWKHSNPCWTCRWFGYLMEETSVGVCVKPSLSPVQAVPREGCAFWVREPGADDVVGPPPRLRAGDPARRAIDAERARLVKITALGEPAKLDGMRIYPECVGRSGILGLSDYHTLRGDDVARAEAAIERLGVNAAIRAGRL